VKIKAEVETNDYKPSAYNESFTKRTNLNDLLKKVKEQRKIDKKVNLLILSAVAGLFAVVVLIVSF
tara:strand:+ start:299 stop:496 length:198 start_codon:yes stop_codon:yes gene_type:complete